MSQKRLWGEKLILGARDVLLDLGKRGVVIRTIKAHSFTPDGIRLMRHIGFTETVPKAPGLRDFMIDVEQSGLPFIREYKEALKKWQEESNQTNASKNGKRNNSASGPKTGREAALKTAL